MKAESKRSVRTVLRWLLGVATVLMAALLIWQCVTIYHEGIAPENMGENGLRIHGAFGPFGRCWRRTSSPESRSRRNRFARRWRISR